MGVDIEAYVERWTGNHWIWMDGPLFPGNKSWGLNEPLWKPFPGRDARLFGFLAGVRDSDVPVIHPPRGVPDDLSDGVRELLSMPDEVGVFGHSWATGMELIGFDFDTEFEGWDGWTSVREHLGDWLDRFDEIARLADNTGHIRVVYAFNS